MSHLGKRVLNFFQTQTKDPRFSDLDQADELYFRDVLGEKNIVSSTYSCPDDLRPFNVDFTKKYVGRSSLVLTPTTTEQVSKILAYCN